MWRGGLGRGLCSLLARPFVCGCHIISTMPRFHTPLIKPDGRFSRIRLPDKATHTFAHETVGASSAEADTAPTPGTGMHRGSGTYPDPQGQRVLDFPLFYRNFCLY